MDAGSSVHHLPRDCTRQSARTHTYARVLTCAARAQGADEEDVRASFARFGHIDNVRIIRDKVTGLGKGFGYVQFRNASSVDAAVQAARSGALSEHGTSAAAVSPRPSRRSKYRTATPAQGPETAKGSSGLVLRIGPKAYPLRVMPSMKKTELVRFQRRRSFVKRGGSKVPFPSQSFWPAPLLTCFNPRFRIFPAAASLLLIRLPPAPCHLSLALRHSYRV